MNRSAFSSVILLVLIIQVVLVHVAEAMRLETQDTICNGGSAVVVLVVDPQLEARIRTGLDQFEEDLCNSNYTVIERASDFTSPLEVRNYLSELYTLTNEQLEGAIFIGEIPWAYQLVKSPSNPEGNGYEVISFQYYSDLNGIFAASPNYTSPGNHTFSYDLHTGDVDWEIWNSILPFYKGDLSQTVDAINRYFVKNHSYRTGGYNLPNVFMEISELDVATTLEEHNFVLNYMRSGIYSWMPLSDAEDALLYFDTFINDLSVDQGYTDLSLGVANFTVLDTHGWTGASGKLTIQWVESNQVKTAFMWSNGCSVGNLDSEENWLTSVVYSTTSHVLLARGSTNSSGGMGNNQEGFFGHNIATQLVSGTNFGQAILSHVNVPLVYPYDDDREFHFAMSVNIGDPTLGLQPSESLRVHTDVGLPETITLHQNYPNPFNPSTTISYGLVKDSHVTVEIYDILGKLITTLINTEQSQGLHSVIWNGTNQHGEPAHAGLYISRITSGNEMKTGKLMLLK